MILAIMALLLVTFGWVAHFSWKNNTDGKENIAFPIFVIALVVGIVSIIGSLIQ